jgi:hypothetical protein
VMVTTHLGVEGLGEPLEAHFEAWYAEGGEGVHAADRRPGDETLGESAVPEVPAAKMGQCTRTGPGCWR